MKASSWSLENSMFGKGQFLIGSTTLKFDAWQKPNLELRPNIQNLAYGKKGVFKKAIFITDNCAFMVASRPNCRKISNFSGTVLRDTTCMSECG